MTLLDRARRLLKGRPPSRFDSLPEDVRAPLAALLSNVRGANLTYVGMRKLKNLAWAAHAVREAGIAGIYLEAGVALGGTAIILGRIKRRDVPLHLYDVFGMIPPPDDDDGEDAHRRYEEIRSGASAGLGNDTYYGYLDDLESIVRRNLTNYQLDEAEDRIRLIKGDFADTLRIDQPIALAHIDCDWYASVTTCIERILPHLSPGGIIVFDDYSSYSGCRRAVDELLRRDDSLEVVFSDKSIGVRKAR